MSTPPFTKAGFQFLIDLRTHNERDWFLPNKARYQELLQEPALAFIREVSPLLKKRVSKRFSGSDAPSGGSLMRIYRDVRFAKDKTPYKTNVGIMFFHEAGKNAPAPGFYLHLEPMACFAGAGCWHPDAPELLKIRRYMAAHPADWKRMKSALKGGTLEGERSARVPKGFDADHPLIEDLKLKSFITSTPISDRDVASATFAERYVALCEGVAPLVGFLCKALGLPY